MTKYKLRAECSKDIMFLLYDFRFKHVQGSRDLVFSDCEVTFSTDLDFWEIIDIFRQKDDLHVPMQTLAEVGKYTGERNYNIR